MRRLCLLGILLMSSVPLPAQHQLATPDGPSYRTSTELVTIDAVATDSDGKPVTNLTRADFEVIVAGRYQTLEQAVYIRTQDQPRALAAAHAAAAPSSGTAAAARSQSAASRVLRRTGTTPDRIARTIAIVVDDLGLSFRSMYDTRRAIHKYIDTQMEPGDLVAIIRTAGGVGALQQFTTDKRLLHAAVDHLQADFRSRQGGVGAFEAAAPRNIPDRRGSNDFDDLHDALSLVGSIAALEYVARGVSPLPGRKCIIYFSEGFSSLFNDRMGSGDRRTGGSERIWRAMARMLARVNAAGVVIYTIAAEGLETGGVMAEDNVGSVQWSPPGQPGSAGDGSVAMTAPSQIVADNHQGIIDGQESLKFIADQTGGLALANTNDLNLGISRALDDQQGYYLLGYTPPPYPDSPRSGWEQNRVKVKVKRPGLRIRARQGFFGPLDSETPKPESADPLVMSALSPFSAGDIMVRLTSMFAHDMQAGSYVRSLVFIDPGDLHFEVNGAGKHVARFQVLLMAIGEDGKLLDGWRREVPLALTDENFRLITERGLVVTVRTEAKEPGPYQMRAAVKDLNSTHVGSAAQFLEVLKVGRGKFALSGVLLKGLAESDAKAGTAASRSETPEGLTDAVLLEPEVRVLSPGVNAVYAYEIYDGLKDNTPDLQMATALIRGGRVVYQSPFTPVTAAPKSDTTMRAIPIAGTLALGEDMPAGQYTLEVTVRRGDATKSQRKQWLDFEIRR